MTHLRRTAPRPTAAPRGSLGDQHCAGPHRRSGVDASTALTAGQITTIAREGERAEDSHLSAGGDPTRMTRPRPGCRPGGQPHEFDRPHRAGHPAAAQQVGFGAVVAGERLPRAGPLPSSPLHLVPTHHQRLLPVGRIPRPGHTVLPHAGGEHPAHRARCSALIIGEHVHHTARPRDLTRSCRSRASLKSRVDSRADRCSAAACAWARFVGDASPSPSFSLLPRVPLPSPHREPRCLRCRRCPARACWG